MSKETNPALIGIFVLGAIALAIVALTFIGGTEWFAQKQRYVIYFQSSINGLNVGAPVKLSGVQIGQVTDIRVQYDTDTQRVLTPVYVEVQQDRVLPVGERHPEVTKVSIERLIELGLRARLQLQSVVTGQLYIEVNFIPNSPIELVGKETSVPEVPTLPSSLEEIENTVAEAIAEIRRLPIKDMFGSVLKSLQHIEDLVGSQDIRQTISLLNQNLASMQATIEHLNASIDPLTHKIGTTFDMAQGTIQHLDAEIKPTLQLSRQALTSLDQTLTQTQQTLQHLEQGTTADSPLYHELLTTLNELSTSARAIRLLADNLQRHPESLLYGKGTTEKRP